MQAAHKQELVAVQQKLSCLLKEELLKPQNLYKPKHEIWQLKEEVTVDEVTYEVAKLKLPHPTRGLWHYELTVKQLMLGVYENIPSEKCMRIGFDALLERKCNEFGTCQDDILNVSITNVVCY